MNDEQFINEMNGFIEELAGKEPTDAEIKERFGNDLTNIQIEAVRTYVTDVQKRGTLTEEEAEYVKDYLSSLPDVSDIMKKELSACTFEELVNRYLTEVVKIAKELHEEGLQISEMIAEGNLGLAEAAMDAQKANDTDAYIRDSVRLSIQEYVDSVKQAQDVDDKIVFQVDLLNKTIDKLVEENGTKPNVDELANAMGIPQQKVLDIIKLAGEDNDSEAQENEGGLTFGDDLPEGFGTAEYEG